MIAQETFRCGRCWESHDWRKKVVVSNHSDEENRSARRHICMRCPDGMEILAPPYHRPETDIDCWYVLSPTADEFESICTK